MSGLVIVSDSESENASENANESQSETREGARDEQQVQQRLEQYTRRLSQLGLGLDSEGSSEISEIRAGQTLQRAAVPDVVGISRPSSPQARSPSSSGKAISATPEGDSIDLSGEPQYTVHREQKIQIKFQPIGSIAMIRPSTCQISYTKPFSLVTLFLTRKLKVSNVFCYINNSFAPSPQQKVGDLWSQFKINGELIVSYCGIEAFG